jgi:hypothetical protein
MTLIALTMFAINPLAEPLPEIVLLDFTASYCGPCQEMVPVIQRMQKADFPIRKVNLSEHPDIARRFQVEKIPTFILLVNGQEKQRVVGKCSEGELRHIMNAEYDALHPGRKSAEEVASAPRPVAAAEEQRPGGLRGLFARIREGFGGRPQQTGFQHPTFRAQSPEPLPAEAVGKSAMAATVRIRVTRQLNKEDVGTGSIVHSTPEKSTILTCAHLFRDLDKDSKIEVDVFSDGRTLRYHAELVAGDDESDLAILRIAANEVLPTVELAPASVKLRSGDAVFSLGCNQGQIPTHMPVSVVQVNRYLGPSNIVCTTDPAVGRSGGGLFNLNGQLVGVCSCADRDQHEGLYMGRKPVHQLFATSRLTHLLSAGPNSKEPTEFAVNSEFSNDELITAIFEEASTDVDAADDVGFFESPADSEIPRFEAAEPSVDFSQLTSGESNARASAASPLEITVIINSVDGTRPKELVVIKRPSPWLLELLTGDGPTAPALAAARKPDLSSTSVQQMNRQMTSSRKVDTQHMPRRHRTESSNSARRAHSTRTAAVR